MKMVGPILFCFAILCVAATFLFPTRGGVLFFVGWAVIGAASLAWGIYLLVHRRWSGLFFVSLGVVELLMISPVLHHQQQ